jgi:hypothetical protein
MPARGFVLSFTGPAAVNTSTIANLTEHELKQRGWNIQRLDSQSSAIVLAVINSNTLETPENLRDSLDTVVEVVIRTSTNEEHSATEKRSTNEERDNEVEDQHRNLTKIVLPPDAEPEQCVADIFSKLEGLELIAGPGPKDSSYDEDDEATIRSRLEALGYL